MVTSIDFYVIATKARPTKFIKDRDELVHYFLDATRFFNEDYAMHFLKHCDYNPEDFVILSAYANIEV